MVAGKLVQGTRLKARMPMWLWPFRSAKWITYDASGRGNEKTILFLGESRPAAEVAAGQPPDWLTQEIPPEVAAARPPAAPACAVKP